MSGREAPGGAGSEGNVYNYSNRGGNETHASHPKLQEEKHRAEQAAKAARRKKELAESAATNAAAVRTPPPAHKSTFSIALICTASRRIPASARTNQGLEKGDLIPLWSWLSLPPPTPPRFEPPSPKPHTVLWSSGFRVWGMGFGVWGMVHTANTKPRDARRSWPSLPPPTPLQYPLTLPPSSQYGRCKTVKARLWP